MKPSVSFASDWTDSLKKWQEIAGNDSIEPSLVHGGAASNEHEGVLVRGLQDIEKISPGTG